MIQGASTVFKWGTAVAFVALLALPNVPKSQYENCVPLDGHPGARVCGGQVRTMVALAAGLRPTATTEVIVADPLPTKELVKIPAWALPSCRELWPEFMAAGAEFGVDPALVMIVGLVESGCGQAQASGAGAQGVLQVMPATAVGIAQNLGESLPADWRTNKPVNIRLGAQYFAQQMRSCAGAGAPQVAPDYLSVVRCACIGYNAGGGWISRWINQGRAPDESKMHARWVGGMWTERHNGSSPTLEEWCAMTSWCKERGQ
jgi:hypothetical protein